MKPAQPGAPTWFDLSNYGNVGTLDAADWLLNLQFRNWVWRYRSGEGMEAIRKSPVLRRADPAAADAVRSAGYPPWDEIARAQRSSIEDLLKDPPRLRSGVEPLSVGGLYYFERRLPKSVRDAAASDPALASGTPNPMDQRLDHAFDQQYVSRFVRINLALPDSVLIDDLKQFLQKERADLARAKGRFSAAVREIRGRKLRPDLSVLSTCALLPYLDVLRWSESDGVTLSDYALFTLIGLSHQKALDTTRRYAEIATDNMTLLAWLGPLVRRPQAKRRPSAPRG